MAKDVGAAIAAKVRKAAVTDRRSPLYLWMLANHAGFSATVAEAGRPNWKALSEAFAEEGLMDLKNKPPTPEGARLTWLKVRKVVKARDAERSAARLHQAGRTQQRDAPPPLPGTGADDAADDAPPPKHDWTPTKLR